MNKIAQYIQDALPDRQYLRLVNLYLLGRESSDRFLDPFAPDIVEDRTGDAYVERKEVEEAVLQPGCSILLGKPGIGKTTLARYFVNKIAEGEVSRSLVISMPIPSIRAALPPDPFNAGEISVLTAESVAILVFKAFWYALIVDPTSRKEHLGTLRTSERWMRSLRNFYGKYASAALPVEDFELHAWLNARECSADYSVKETSEASLQGLLAFVTDPAVLKDVYGRTTLWPYPRVRFFVDGTEHFSGPAVQRLMRDAQQLYHSYRGKLDLKLFLDSTWQTTARQLSWVQQGRVPLYTLPAWTQAELRTLLKKRISAHLRPGESEEALPLEYWARRLPMPAAAQASFFDIILEAAPESRSSEFPPPHSKRLNPNPLQILRLTRGLLGVASRLMHDSTRPTKKDLKEIVDAYWNEESRNDERSREGRDVR
jgi:hypothetical protein